MYIYQDKPFKADVIRLSLHLHFLSSCISDISIKIQIFIRADVIRLPLDVEIILTNLKGGYYLSIIYYLSIVMNFIYLYMRNSNVNTCLSICKDGY